MGARIVPLVEDNPDPLVADVPIGRDEHVESSSLRRVQELAVAQNIPAVRAGFLDSVIR